MAAFDFKKAYKELYLPKNKPGIIDVPEMRFIMVDGKGDPNTAASYKEAVELLYGLSYSIKMSKKSGTPPPGYFDYVVPPLEGLWWFEENYFDGNVIERKTNLTGYDDPPTGVRHPGFLRLQGEPVEEKPELDISRARLEDLMAACAPRSCTLVLTTMRPPLLQCWKSSLPAGILTEMSGLRQHHEIYLSDPRKTEPEKLKTVIRHPIARR